MSSEIHHEIDYELIEIQQTKMWDLGYNDAIFGLENRLQETLPYPEWFFSYIHGFQIGLEDLNDQKTNYERNLR